MDPLEHLEEHFRSQVFGGLALPIQVARQVTVNFRRELLVQLPERLAVARLGPHHKLLHVLDHRCHVSSPADGPHPSFVQLRVCQTIAVVLALLE